MVPPAVSSFAELMRNPEGRRWMAVSILAWDWPKRRRELEDANGVLILKLFMPVGHLMQESGWCYDVMLLLGSRM